MLIYKAIQGWVRVPDHPWVDSADGAAVRIAMSVIHKGEGTGRLDRVIKEKENGGLEKNVSFVEVFGRINCDLTIGSDVSATVPLKSNNQISSFGMMLAGSGFIVNLEKAQHLGLGTNPELDNRIRPYRNGKDLTSTPRGVMLIDMYPLKENEVRTKFPEVYQHLYEHVKPERDQNNRRRLKEQWWLFGECRQGLRSALAGLSRFISTVETAKHRFFIMQDVTIMPDHKLINIALDDFYFLGVLSSQIHVIWSLASGGTLEDRPVYNSTRCFQTFPFPIANDEQKQTIRDMAEKLDAHRKQRQALHPMLTITDMYNVLEKLRAGEALNAKDQKVHEQGLVSILKQLHDELDAAVAEAYGWPANLSEEEVLERLVALNKERAAEEARGLIRWLRPEYQNPNGVQQTGMSMEAAADTPNTTSQELQDWPKTLAEQAQAVQRALQQYDRPISAEDLYQHFKPGSKSTKAQRIQQMDSLLQTFSTLGLLRRTDQGQYVK